VGNEGFKSFSAAWEVGVYDLVKDELRRHAFSDRESTLAELEAIARATAPLGPDGDRRRKWPTSSRSWFPTARGGGALI
jgi:hypothetical protein